MARDRRYGTARWRRLREQVIRRDGGRCSVAGCTADMSEPRMTHIDHVVEVRDGGDFWAPRNLRTVCRFHHLEKSVATIAARATSRATKKIPAPYDPANPPKGCTCKHLDGAQTPRSPNGLFCPVCETIIQQRKD